MTRGKFHSPIKYSECFRLQSHLQIDSRGIFTETSARGGLEPGEATRDRREKGYGIIATSKSRSEIAETITEESGRFNQDFNGTGIMQLIFLPAIRMHASTCILTRGITVVRSIKRLSLVSVSVL